jgi:tetratricopeptide (TPR) repeat protein
VTRTNRGSVTTAISLAALLLFVAGRCLVPMDETDLFFNLRLGEIVLGEHAVPRTNLLSFTFPDYRDVNLAWLFQIVLALAHRAGGIPGTVLLKTAFVVATFTILFRVACRRGAHPAAAAAALALAAWAAEPRFVERPHLCTFLGLATMWLALERTEAGRPRLLYALVPLALVWANANSCFFLAPALLALYAVGAWRDGRVVERRQAAVVALALVPFIFATPSGTEALTYIANHWRMPSLRPLQEYRSASWPLDGPFFFLAAGVALAAALPDRCRRQLYPALALGLLGARRIRFVAEFALAAGPIVAVALTEVARRAAARAASFQRPQLARQATAIVVGALSGATLVPRLAAAIHGEPFMSLGIEAGLVPTAAIRFAEQSGLADRMYNDLEVGSYLTWRWWPRRRVFQDPRINGYPPAMHALLKRDDLTVVAWQGLLDRFRVTSALVTYPDVNPRAALFDPQRWALVYRDAESLLFAARSPEQADLIAHAEIPLSFRYTRAAGAEPRPLPGQPARSPVPACEWSRRLGDVWVELGDDARAIAAYRAARAISDCLDAASDKAAALALGDAALRRHDPATATAAYAGIDLPRAHRNRGLALLAIDRPGEALVELEAALAADPSDADARRAEGIARQRLAAKRAE